MELLATRDEKQVWHHALARPYRLTQPPFPGQCYVGILFANDPTITPEEQATLSADLVHTDCRYAVCAGHECSSWDDSIDAASPPTDGGEIDPATFVMTTWHEDESVEDIIFYGLFNTMFEDHDFRHYLILTIGDHPGQREEIQRAITSRWDPQP